MRGIAIRPMMSPGRGCTSHDRADRRRLLAKLVEHCRVARQQLQPNKKRRAPHNAWLSSMIIAKHLPMTS